MTCVDLSVLVMHLLALSPLWWWARGSYYRHERDGPIKIIILTHKSVYPLS